MNIIEMKEQLQYFTNEDIGIIIYFILKDNNVISIKIADIDNQQALPELRTLFTNSIRRQIIEQESIQVMNISESDERNNTIYQYDLEEIPIELSVIATILQNPRQPNFNFAQDTIRNIKGYIIMLGDTENKLLLYKQHYGVSLIRRDSHLFYKDNERFVRLNEDLIRLDDNFQFFSLNGDLFIKDLDKLEKFFGFHDVIKREAISSIMHIEGFSILEDVEVLRESIENIAFARKLTRLSTNSPVLGNIPVPAIIEFTRNYPALTGKLKYSEDGSKIRLDTKASQELFVKLLNDNYLKSELTDLYYASLAKDKIEQNLAG